MKPYYQEKGMKRLLIYSMVLTIASKGLVSLVNIYNLNYFKKINLLVPILSKIDNQLST